MKWITDYKTTLELPNIVGMDIAEAVDTLKGLGLKPVKVADEYDKNLPEGSVIWQIPTGGMKVKKGRTIRLAVSLGGQRVLLPELSGVILRQVEIELERMGLVVGDITYEHSEKLREETVINTIPPSQTILNKGDTVSLVVSKGAIERYVIVPNFIGYPVNEKLSKEVSKAGLIMGEIRIKRLPDVKRGTIFEQTPYSGQRVPRGTVIEFVANEGEYTEE